MIFIKKKNSEKIFQEKKEGLSFSRFEIKFILNNKTSISIQEKIQKFMDLDGYAKNIASKQYFVRSLYYDNDNFNNFNEKADGLKIRHKFRIRTYSKNKNKFSITYLEKKGRYNERTFKIRKKILVSQLDKFYNNSKNFKLSSEYNNDPLINEFIVDTYKKLIKPKVVIDYNRKPFINRLGNYFRLTFDSNIVANASNNLFNLKNKTKKVIPGFEILEVKFDRTIPPWFQKLIQSFELQKVSVSKYVLGCESAGLAYDYEGR